ncbi:MAG: dTDP-4-dehydrorhamnose 3,5-epimerase family protein [bacterium]|nr:dTDP-4-dehydrorhamnose 3,5-epimerase family protein [bacterium]
MIKVAKTNLDKVLLVTLSDAFEDFRGQYIEIYNEKLYRENGIDIKFIQDDVAISHKNVLRGIHGDLETWKLISCLSGKIYVVIVNCDADSKEFGKWQSFALSDENRQQVLVPPKHGNSYLTLSDTSIYHYKQSTYYNRSGQFTYKWNDPKFNISWPIKDPILSERDK